VIQGGKMAARIVLLPILDDQDARAALKFGHRCADYSQAVLQLLYLNLSQSEETPESLINRLSFTPRDLFNSMVSIIACQPEDCEKVILTASARPEVELLVLSNAPARQELITKLFEQASCPIALSHFEHNADKPIKRLIVPLDGSPTSASAIEPALRFAADENAQLHVLHIAAVGNFSNEPGSLPIGTYMDQPQYEWPIWMREFWDRFLVCVKEIAPNIKPQLHVAQGEVGAQIEQFVRALDGDLVAMAINSDKALAQRLMRNLTCPLLLVRPTQQFAFDHCINLSKSRAA
jgi:nucleotide-binding universal stress UspA family protein